MVLGDLLTPDSIVCAIDRDIASLMYLSEVLDSSAIPFQVHPLQADFQDSLPLAGLDGVLFANSLHFSPSEIREAFFARIVGFLKPGGQLIVVEYNTRNAHAAIPYPLDEFEFHRLTKMAALSDAQICARAPSTFGGEMYAGTAIRT
jgi:SAM-dependent methyltransferase